MRSSRTSQAVARPSDKLQSIPGDVLDIAILKATQAGLFPRHCSPDDHLENRQIMEAILLAALDISGGNSVGRSTSGKSPPGECSSEGNPRC